MTEIEAVKVLLSLDTAESMIDAVNRLIEENDKLRNELSAERDRCAKIAENYGWSGIPSALSHHGKLIAVKIREPR